VEILGNHLSHTTKETILNSGVTEIIETINGIYTIGDIDVEIISRIINHHSNTTILIEVGMTEIHQTIPHIILATQTAILLPTICLEGPRLLKRPYGLKDDH
jgi:hypothetical protein